MIPFEEMDERLAKLGKNRAWLSEATDYSEASVREALAPNSKKRSKLLHRALSGAIEKEEHAQREQSPSASLPPGMHEIFLTDEQLDRADRASRLVRAPSLADFCRDAIELRAKEIGHRAGGILRAASGGKCPAIFREIPPCREAGSARRGHRLEVQVRPPPGMRLQGEPSAQCAAV